MISYILLIFSLLFITFPLHAHEFSGEVGSELRVFPLKPQGPRQFNTANLSVYFQPEYYHAWDNRKQSVTVEPFIRLDQNDPERTHFDIRELFWEKAAQSWELRVGFKKVFWGVTETQHLIDIINQTDSVENTDQEDKLGQPMVNFAWIQNWGTLNFFVLPGFRERTFSGREGRLRTPLYVDTDQAFYESADEDRRVDLAMRWSHYIGSFDLGVAHFYGTGREPTLLLDFDKSGNPVLRPFYEIIHQTSLDVQSTLGGWLLKLEALTRSGQGRRFYAFSGGFEYTLVGIFGSSADLGLLSEYHFDDRFSSAPNPLEDDFFIGTRFTLNDTQSTELLSGIILDRQTGPSNLFLETSRRLGSHWKLTVEGRFFVADSPNDLLYQFRKDHLLQFELAYFF